MIPSFNDWDCLNLLIPKIDEAINKTKDEIEVLVVNDGSSEKNTLDFKELKTLKKVEILNLEKNVKAQIAIASGLSYLRKQNFKGGVIVMDADGQDDPLELLNIISESKKNQEKIITINRTSREDGILFKIFYHIFLYLTFILTFKHMKFGVYSYIHSSSFNKILSTYDIQMAYAAALAKHFNDKNIIYSPRKKRILGESKNNYISLIIYALKIISVFKIRVLINSLVLFFIIFLLVKYKIFSILLAIFVILFNIIIFIISSQVKLMDEKNILLNIKNTESVKF